MRSFSTAVAGEINRQFGSEALVIVGIQWEDGAEVLYTDQKLSGEEYPYPFLVSIGNFDVTTIVSGQTDSQSVEIVLNDIDGSLRNIIDTKDIHFKTVKVYLGFQGLPATEKALMFEGRINSPIDWDEGARTLSLTAITQLEDSEAGFVPDDYTFPYINPDQRNQPWPLVFGDVCNMKAVRVSAFRQGFLGASQGAVDPTIEERLCQANKLECPNIPPALPTAEESQAITVFAFYGNSTYNPTLNQPANVKVSQEDKQCLARRFNEICTILSERAQQQQYVNPTLTVRNGGSFPQNQLIQILVGEMRYEGRMNGETFTITQTFHPDDDIENPSCREPGNAAIGYRGNDTGIPTTVTGCAQGGQDLRRDVVGGSGESWRIYQEFQRGRFIWLPAGTKVYLQTEAEVLNIVSLLPGTVNQVSAYRTFGDTTILTEVPTDRYTVYTIDYGGYEVVEVRLVKPLSTYRDEDWDDDIYVSFTSDVGPNPVEIIEYLLDKYTSYTPDATSFAAVQSLVNNYPTNFAVKDRPSALALIQDIAYQSRIATVIRNGVMYLTYLSKEPTSIQTLTEDDILRNTFRITHTPTEELVTKHLIHWSEAEAGVYNTDPVNLEFVLKHNVPKYGTIQQDYTYDKYNIFELVEKSATFWMIRNSNTWKYVEFETPMKHLALDVFDCITLNIDQFPTVKCVILSTNYNADSNTISFRCWTPILAGTSTAYTWAWPSQQVAVDFPVIDDDPQEGDGYDFQVIPPEGHPLRGGYDPDAARIATAGDANPSDLDDVMPTLECHVSTGAEIAVDLEPVIIPFQPLAEESFANDLDEKEAQGLNASYKGPDGEEDTSDQESFEDYENQERTFCDYRVTVLEINPTSVTKSTSPGGTCHDAGPCDDDPSLEGRPCNGSFTNRTHVFGTYYDAVAFRASQSAIRDAMIANCQYRVGVPAPYTIGVVTTHVGTYPGTGEDVPCDTSTSPSGNLLANPELAQPSSTPV